MGGLGPISFRVKDLQKFPASNKKAAEPVALTTPETFPRTAENEDAILQLACSGFLEVFP